jgi:NAD(P)-dependent dehydrogenase (short-subunit alcohol dehydrogenase family)
VSVAVVTGAGRGIGAATADALVAKGFDVVRADLQPADGVEAVDVRSADSLRALAAVAAARGDVTVWVNNAGVMLPKAAWDGTDADVDLQVHVNLLGVMHGSRAALGVMRTGDIVNIASMSAYGPVPGIAAYAATKAGVRSWTLSLDAELRAAHRGVRVHAVCPDPVDTRLVNDVAGDPGMEMVHASPGLLTPERIAEAVVGLLGSRRVVRSVPGWRAALAQLSSLAPGATRPAVDAMRKVGARRQAKREHAG